MIICVVYCGILWYIRMKQGLINIEKCVLLCLTMVLSLSSLKGNNNKTSKVQQKSRWEKKSKENLPFLCKVLVITLRAWTACRWRLPWKPY